jgi:hypothetical protein
MKDHNPHDPVNMIGEAYELLLEKTMRDLHMQDSSPTRNPSNSIRHLRESANGKSYWLETEKNFIKISILELLSHAGDKTTIELRRLSDTNNNQDNYVTKESSDFESSYESNPSNKDRFALKTKTPHYKTCSNKSFWRQQ